MDLAAAAVPVRFGSRPRGTCAVIGGATGRGGVASACFAAGSFGIGCGVTGSTGAAGQVGARAAARAPPTGACCGSNDGSGVIKRYAVNAGSGGVARGAVKVGSRTGSGVTARPDEKAGSGAASLGGPAEVCLAAGSGAALRSLTI